MRIGINGNPLIYPIPSGTKHYSEELLQALLQIDKTNTYIIYTNKPFTLITHCNVINRIYPTSKYYLLTKERSGFSAYVKHDRVNIFHNLDPYSSIFFNHKGIITTVHDTRLDRIFSINVRDTIEKVNCEVRRHFVFKNTKAFISVSKSVYHEVEKFRRPHQSNFMIYEGVNCNFKEIPNIKKNRILAFSDFSARKNIFRAYAAWNSLPIQFRDKYRLTIIVSSDKFMSNIDNSIISKRSKNIEIVINTSSEQLISLYNESICLLYPSLYEGFGLPILEAMACGCPVITTNYGATKEIAGDAALLVNPLLYKNISHGIKTVITNKRIRSALIEKGKKRALNFTWLKTAQETLKIYNKVANDL